MRSGISAKSTSSSTPIVLRVLGILEDLGAAAWYKEGWLGAAVEEEPDVLELLFWVGGFGGGGGGVGTEPITALMVFMIDSNISWGRPWASPETPGPEPGGGGGGGCGCGPGPWASWSPRAWTVTFVRA